MITLLKRELSTQFGTLTGMVVSILFLIIVGLFLWVYPESSLLENGYASLQVFFDLAPWTFLFLIPASTMRLFSEEKKNGTLETLFTKPIQDWELIFAKFFSVVILTLLTLLPTVYYFFTLYRLGLPAGNIDQGAVIGSYIGLILLGASFSAIGLFCSSLSSNPIVSFLLAAVLCFFLYSGLDSLSKLTVFSTMESWLPGLGIRYHYSSISRGVLDTRDLLYFLSISGLFLYLTKLNLESRKW